jgi:hypothetical protein
MPRLNAKKSDPDLHLGKDVQHDLQTYRVGQKCSSIDKSMRLFHDPSLVILKSNVPKVYLRTGTGFRTGGVIF